MSEPSPTRRAETALENHGAFERTGEGYRVTTTPFDALVSVSDDGEEAAYRVTVTLPTLDSVVKGETVADVVEDGWFETLELRLDEPHQAGRRLDPIEPTVERDPADGTVTVEMAFASAEPERAAENAKALVDFVEGTWVQGLVPGYEYRDPAASLLERAAGTYDEGSA